MQRMVLRRSSKRLLVTTALAIVALTGLGALAYTKATRVVPSPVNPKSVAPVQPARPIDGFATIQGMLNHTTSGGTVTFPRGVTYIIAKPLVVPPNITVNGSGSILMTPADS